MNAGNGDKAKTTKKMDHKAMLDAYIAKFGLGEIIGDMIGDMDPDMTLNEFLLQIEEKGINDVVKDMTLKELFNLKSKSTEPAILKENILKLLSKKPGLTVSQIGESLGEKGKHLSVAMAALKKSEKVLGEGEKRNMKYTVVA